MRRLSTTALTVRGVTKATADFDIEHSDHLEIAEDVIDSETGRGRIAIHSHLNINARHPSIACEGVTSQGEMVGAMVTSWGGPFLSDGVPACRWLAELRRARRGIKKKRENRMRKEAGVE